MSEVEDLKGALHRIAAALPVHTVRDADEQLSIAVGELWDLARRVDRQELTDIVQMLAIHVGEQIQNGHLGLERVQSELTSYANDL